MTATGGRNGPPVPPALPPRIYRSTSMCDMPSSKPIKLPRKNLIKTSSTISEEIPENIYEDPDALLNSIADVSQSEAKPRPIPRPRIKAKPNPYVQNSNNTTVANNVNVTKSAHNDLTNTSYHGNKTNTTYNANTSVTINKANTTNTRSTTYSPDTTSGAYKTGTTTKTNANTVITTHNIGTPSSDNASIVDSTYKANRTNTANSSDRSSNTTDNTSYHRRKDSNGYMIPRPAHKPPLPPMLHETNGVNSKAAGGPQDNHQGTNSNTSVRKPPPVPPRLEVPSLYHGRENPTPQPRDTTSRNRAPPLPRPRIYQSASMLDLSNSEGRETPYLSNYEEEHYNSSQSSQYTNNFNPPYTEIIQDFDFHHARASTRRYDADNQSTNSNMYQFSDDISELLLWLKRVSKQSDIQTLYGLNMEDEISCFRRQAMHVRKARRLYGLLMMKRKDALQNSLKEFRAICERLDKVQKTNKNMGIAGGTTGAVGGVTAVVGIALAPMTMGVSLIATAVGAGIAASAGGFGAHAAKANKKVVNRETVEKLVNDYKSDVADLEQCLHYILCAMKELQRHNVVKMQKAGAPQDALRMADLSRAVLHNNTYSSRQMSPSPGGMTSESLLKQFVAEFDFYFTEKSGQKLKKSNKSRFSARVCTLVRNLQEELNYLTQMWETLS
ncbi:rhoGEF domain-containing protein gxcI isoform X1 [Fundulus heteroclitus]|uniref:rhoGEF domain-containing protein gxcI isoform X1 n=1 Tax=Fundulus heteroclitus TaxID=8078 RepID=UPI00165ABDDB|nr:rhoGEF domain-containing protein gxcI isoform X1 [Fundulus heteroclitus]